jgi:hypothetical protein
VDHVEQGPLGLGWEGGRAMKSRGKPFCKPWVDVLVGNADGGRIAREAVRQAMRLKTTETALFTPLRNRANKWHFF